MAAARSSVRKGFSYPGPQSDVTPQVEVYS